jgi:hypothetical protein
MCICVAVVCRMVMTLTANVMSGLVHIQRKFTDPRMARKVSCSGGDIWPFCLGRMRPLHLGGAWEPWVSWRVRCPTCRTFSRISLVYCSCERLMVPAAMFVTMSIPRMNLASPKSVTRNCSPMAHFADVIHSSKSKTIRRSLTYTRIMQTPCTRWLIV